jgi:hypothetical protein
MPYDENMALLFPAKLSVYAEDADSRPAFRVARRFQCMTDGLHTTKAQSIAAQADKFIAAKRLEYGIIPTIEVETVYATLTRSGEIRVLEVMPAAFDQPLSGRLHHVSVDFQLEEGRRFTNLAISVAEGTAVFYTALSYVVSKPRTVSKPHTFADGYLTYTVGIISAGMQHLYPWYSTHDHQKPRYRHSAPSTRKRIDRGLD